MSLMVRIFDTSAMRRLIDSHSCEPTMPDRGLKKKVTMPWFLTRCARDWLPLAPVRGVLSETCWFSSSPSRLIPNMPLNLPRNERPRPESIVALLFDSKELWIPNLACPEGEGSRRPYGPLFRDAVTDALRFPSSTTLGSPASSELTVINMMPQSIVTSMTFLTGISRSRSLLDAPEKMMYDEKRYREPGSGVAVAVLMLSPWILSDLMCSMRCSDAGILKRSTIAFVCRCRSALGMLMLVSFLAWAMMESLRSISCIICSSNQMSRAIFSNSTCISWSVNPSITKGTCPSGVRLSVSLRTTTSSVHARISASPSSAWGPSRNLLAPTVRPPPSGLPLRYISLLTCHILPLTFDQSEQLPLTI
mmetsp:Transcript_58698/g.143881  ORF Transcript_58698/g.143881 Transcript_58698/m.143881 type:complete len:363 (+) Transcript_58698:594-1682(+)